MNYICKILCISQQHLIAIVRRKTREKHHIRQYSHYPSKGGSRGGIPPYEGSANTEEFCEILRKSELFERFLQFFLKGSIAKNKCFRSPVIPCAAQALPFHSSANHFSVKHLGHHPIYCKFISFYILITVM